MIWFLCVMAAVGGMTVATMMQMRTAQPSRTEWVKWVGTVFAAVIVLGVGFFGALGMYYHGAGFYYLLNG